MEPVISQEAVEDICQRYGLTYLGLFGSQARGEAGPDSDIDLLVEYPSDTSLFKFAEIQNALSDRLGKPVDLVPRKTVKKRIKPYIEKDLRVIYEKR